MKNQTQQMESYYGWFHKFHVCEKNRHFNGVVVEGKNEFLDYGEGVRNLHVIIREKGQISAYISGFVCDLFYLMDDAEARELYLELDGEDDVSSDIFLYAMEHTQYLKNISQMNSVVDESNVIFLLDIYVHPELRNKGYMSAMMRGLESAYGDTNIIVAEISDFESTLSADDIRTVTETDIRNMRIEDSLRIDKKQLAINKKIAKDRGFIADSSWCPSATKDCIYVLQDNIQPLL